MVLDSFGMWFKASNCTVRIWSLGYISPSFTSLSQPQFWAVTTQALRLLRNCHNLLLLQCVCVKIDTPTKNYINFVVNQLANALSGWWFQPTPLIKKNPYDPKIWTARTYIYIIIYIRYICIFVYIYICMYTFETTWNHIVLSWSEKPSPWPQLGRRRLWSQIWSEPWPHRLVS